MPSSDRITRPATLIQNGRGTELVMRGRFINWHYDRQIGFALSGRTPLPGLQVHYWRIRDDAMMSSSYREVSLHARRVHYSIHWSRWPVKSYRSHTHRLIAGTSVTWMDICPPGHLHPHDNRHREHLPLPLQIGLTVYRLRFRLGSGLLWLWLFFSYG